MGPVLGLAGITSGGRRETHERKGDKLIRMFSGVDLRDVEVQSKRLFLVWMAGQRRRREKATVRDGSRSEKLLQRGLSGSEG